MIRPGITSRVHRVEGLGEWGELEIRGVIVDNPSDTPPPGFYAAELVSFAPARTALEGFRAAGVRVVLVRIHAAGGRVPTCVALEDAFRRFSEGGGTLITYVDRVAASAAAPLALWGDIVTMAPDAAFAVHRVLGFGFVGATIVPLAANLTESLDQRQLRVFQERTLTPADLLEAWVHLGPNDRGDPDSVEIGAEDAIKHGWVDAVLPPGEVEGLVLAVLAGEPFCSARRLALARRARGVAGWWHRLTRRRRWPAAGLRRL